MVGDAFKALGDPTRRRILELLSEGEMSAGDIAAHFDMAKPSVSHHLNILKNAGLVTDVNCTPFVRQYDILDNKWGALL